MREGKNLVRSYTISLDVSQHICPVDKNNNMFTHKIWKIQKTIQKKHNVLHGSINIIFICHLMLFSISLTILSRGNRLCSFHSLVSKSGHSIPLGFWNLLQP